MEPDVKTEEQRHYDNLISFFKYLVTTTIAAIAIVVAVVVFFTFQNMSDARQEVTKSFLEIKSDVSNANEKLLRTFENLQLQAKEEVQNFKEETRNYALNETKIRVAEAFEENKIRQLVEITAEKKLREKLESIVEEQMIITKQRIENLMKVVPSLVLAVDKIRNGDRTGLALLDSLRYHDEDPLIRDLANNVFKEKARDYLEYHLPYFKGKTIKNYIGEFNLNPNISVNDTMSILKGIVSFIQTDQDLNQVASAIMALNKLSDENFNMFDFESINEWANKYFKNK